MRPDRPPETAAGLPPRVRSSRWRRTVHPSGGLRQHGLDEAFEGGLFGRTRDPSGYSSFSIQDQCRRDGVRGDAEGRVAARITRSEEHTSELQSRGQLVCRLLLEKKKETQMY